MAAEPEARLPTTGDDLDAAWFTSVLAETGAGSVVAVERSVIGDGIGFVGELHRCALTWDRVDASLPASVVVKLPSTNEKNRSLAEALAAYEREIVVYRDLSTDLGLPMPALLYADFDPHPAPWLEKVLLFLFERMPQRTINWLIDRLLRLASKSTRVAPS